MKFFSSSWFPVLLALVITVVIFKEVSLNQGAQPKPSLDELAKGNEWRPPDEASIPFNEEGNMIRYGKNLIAHTSDYLGPKGSVAHLTNYMNCQNCHINAGQQLFGNCFAAVASTYPKFRERSGKIESIEFKVNECMQRSLNGKPLNSSSKEMKAIVAYLKWIGSNVPKGIKPAGAGTEELSYLSRAANPEKGKIVYINQCARCHGANGEGLFSFDSTSYTYPPLWGAGSYNVSAGMFRLTKLAGFIKNNMPFGTTWQSPQLTVDESWDVAAYINSQTRSNKTFAYDWPKISSKPVDYPFGPYTDNFSEKQHKYGPFSPIIQAKK